MSHTPNTHDQSAATGPDQIRPRAGRDLGAIRDRLANARGKGYWRSLDELARTDEFLDYLHHEFPSQADTLTDESTRRRFLQLMGASFALAGVAGCAVSPQEKIVPYVEQPERLVPGKPLFYATATTLGGYANGVLVESHMGRPTKIEGNPEHPISLGATDAFGQASVLDLYDPDRTQIVGRNNGGISTWDNFLGTLTNLLATQKTTKGAGFRILTENVTSPSLAAGIAKVREVFPEAKWNQWEPVGRDNVRAGATLAFGEPTATHYHLDKAAVILALDSDFLSRDPARLRLAREFASRRAVGDGTPAMSRVYAAEAMATITGSAADHRLPIQAGRIADLTAAIAQIVGVGVEAPGSFSPEESRWIAAVAADLQAHRGESAIIVGENQPAAVHALAHAMNAALGNVGETVTYTEPVEADPVDHTASIRELVTALEAGQVDLLLIIGGNPVYTAPADLAFLTVLNNPHTTRIHLSLHEDETSAQCQWHLPMAHELEVWGDARAADGTITIQQPLIAPLYGGKSPLELLAACVGQFDRTTYDIVRDEWRKRGLPGDFEKSWRKAVHDGTVPDTAAKPKAVKLVAPDGGAGAALAALGRPATDVDSDTLELNFLPDPTLWDGRFANNGWLQELPKPMTKLTWDNAVMLGIKTAQRLKLDDGDVVELALGDGSSSPLGDSAIPTPGPVMGAVFVVPGHAEGSATVTLGYGRTKVGRVGQGTGFNAYSLRTTAQPWIAQGLRLRPTGDRYPLATTQSHRSLDGLEDRNIVVSASLAEFKADPNLVKEIVHTPKSDESLFPDFPADMQDAQYAWGMSVNLNTCIGCNACVVACQAENNIPVVGKEQVLAGREMHWMEIDQYFKGSTESPENYFQPRLCMHCEKAPCEIVCPVGATIHDAEGLNNMVYNRCVGTRYCSNNCPYKVRHFNFFEYAKPAGPVAALGQNPDVTVRTRGVMEKCTYCVQRISQKRISAMIENREIADGEVQTACQGVCPTRAIVFGNLNDPESAVSKLKKHPLDYGMLAELNTRPRTSYMAKLWNHNPALVETKPTPAPAGEGTDHAS